MPVARDRRSNRKHTRQGRIRHAAAVRLAQFGGTVETTFEPTGLIAKLSAMLPENLSTNTKGIVPNVSTVRDTRREVAE